MKGIKHMAVLALLCISAVAVCAQVVERTYISTDKSVYVAGDRIWMSAFCHDASSGTMSEFSSIVYMEMTDGGNTVQTAKIALIHGRGSACMDIPRTVPTGNYKLVPYTSLNVNEEGYDYASCSKTVSVFNPYTTERGPVRLVSAEEYSSARVLSAKQVGGTFVKTSMNGGGRCLLTLLNADLKDADVSVSVFHKDALNEPESMGISEFAGLKKDTVAYSVTGSRVPEYEGEIIRGRLNPDLNAQDRIASLAAPGRMTDVYFAPTYGRDTVSFYTGNIYGDRDMVCDIDMELISPFVNPQIGAPQPLDMCSSTGRDIYERGAASQIERMFCSDTLLQDMPVRATPLLNRDNMIRYNLDDYTRFPTMEEVIVELIPDLKVRKVDGQPYVQVLLSDNEEGRQFSEDRALMLVDGVPVRDHSMIVAYDPLQVRTIEIYPNSYYVGYRSFAGVVNFITYKGNMPGLVFENGLRTISFQGASLPQAYTCKGLVKGSLPDFRQTIYWHPSVKIKAGASDTLECVLPDYTGTFCVTVEGFASDGSPIYVREEFSTARSLSGAQ